MFDGSKSGIYEPYRPGIQWQIVIGIGVILLVTALAIWTMVEFL